jgi:hypothetical protein
MNYKQEILKLMQRVPSAVISGSTNQAISYKNTVEKAIAVTSKARPSEAELQRVLAELQVFEQGKK